MTPMTDKSIEELKAEMDAARAVYEVVILADIGTNVCGAKKQMAWIAYADAKKTYNAAFEGGAK